MSTTITWETEEITETGRLDKTTEVSATTTDIATAWDTKYNIVKRNSKENKLVKELEVAGATDSFLAEWLYDIARNAERAINTKDDGIINVPDYWVQLKALTTIAKIKWHLNNPWEQQDDFDGNVIFID